MIHILDSSDRCLVHIAVTREEMAHRPEDGAIVAAIGSASVWHTEIGGNDYIRLKFSLPSMIRLRLGTHTQGDYANYVVTSEYLPSYNQQTGGYDYDVTMYAWYHDLNRFILKLRPQYGSQETSFSLTDTLSGHIAILEANIRHYFDGYGYPELFVHVDDTVNADMHVTVTYDGAHILDAVSQIAEAFECEWWMQDGNHMHFGRCERDNERMAWILNDNVSSISRSDSSGTLATRLYVYGSTRNIPKRYRKRLEFTADEIDYANKRFRDSSRKIYPDVFSDSVKVNGRVTTTATWPMETVVVRMNPEGAPDDDKSWFYCEQLPQKGAIFTVEGIILGKVDASYFTSDSDDSAISGWEQRLMLPIDTTHGYIDSDTIVGDEGEVDESRIVEQTVVFDDIYPHMVNSIVGVSSYTTEENDASDESGETKVTVTHYKIELSKSEFEFSEEFMIPGQTLSCQFQSGKLAGMTFSLAFLGDGSGINQVYEIKNSEDYGVLLPNAQLYPSEGDKIVITGYDVSYLSADGNSMIADAERRLEAKAREYLKKVEREGSTYTVELSPSYSAAPSTIVYLGSRVSIAYDATEVETESRVIAIERYIDLPYDRARYTVGESSQYSRLSDIEGKIYTSSSTINNGGNGRVDIITSDSGKIPTDSNVYSALSTNRRFLRKDQDDTAQGRITFNRGLQTKDAVDSMLTGNGTLISEDGSRVQTDEIEVRKSMKVMELIINRLRAMAGDFVFDETRKVTKVELIGYEQGHDGSAADDELYGIYKLTLDRDTEFDFHAFKEGDIVYQVVNTIPIGGSDYYTGYYRISSVDTKENSITVFLYHEDVLGFMNHVPVAEYNIAHRGNVNGKEVERLSQWLLSSTEGRITFLDGLTQPTLSQRNYAAYIGKFLSTIDYGRDLPIKDNDTVVFARHLLAENLYMIDYNGEVVVQQPERGEWSLAVAESDKPYRCIYTDEVEHVQDQTDKRHTLLTQDKVTHLGSTWICLTDKTTQEPWVDSADWQCVNGNNTILIEIHSSAGQMFRQGNVETELYAVLLYNGIDITDKVIAMSVRSMRWTRDTGSEADDAAWNDSHEVTRNGTGVRIVQSTSRFDLGARFFSERKSARFTFTVELPVVGAEGSVSYSESITVK